MYSNEDLYKKIGELHKETQSDIATINTFMHKLDKKIDVHVAVAKEQEKNVEKDQNRSSKRNYFITGLIVTISFGLFKILDFLMD